MSSFLKYEWRPNAGGVQIAFTFNGSAYDMVKAIGMMIQQAYEHLRAEDRDSFRSLCRQMMMDDDCPIWHPELAKATTIDLKELRKQMREEAEANE